MQQVLEGLEGIVCLMDDIVVYGQDQAEHDSRLFAALTKLKGLFAALTKLKG